MHFNAAMLEMHSRLHLQDVKQKQQRQDAADQLDTAAQQRLGVKAGRTTSSTPSSSSSVHAIAEHHDWEADHETAATAASDSDEEGDGKDTAAGTAAAEGGEVLGGRKAIAKWFDSGVLRQKEAKAAVLAIRKHLR